MNRALRAAGVGAAGLMFVVGSAAPALADPATPTDYESHVTRIDPATDSVTVSVVGGDAFIEVAAAPGHSVAVTGYRGEPYLEIDAAGVVSINVRSPSEYISRDRYGRTEAPPDADWDAEPVWEVVATDGTYAWHDHRTHWMLPDTPPGVSGNATELVFEWEIPIVVDGEEHIVHGALDWLPGRSLLLPLATTVAVAAGALLLRHRTKIIADAGVFLAAAAAILVIVQWLATPAAGRTTPLGVISPLVALAVFGYSTRRSARPVAFAQAIVVGGFALAAFLVPSVGVLTKPVLPSAIPDVLERVAVAGIAGFAIVCISVGAATLFRLTSVSSPAGGTG